MAASKAGKHDEAIAKFQEALKGRPDCYACQFNIGAGGASAETLYNQGVILWNAGKIAEAKGQFEAAVKAKPDYADAHYRLGMAYLNEGKLPEAGAAFEKYVELAPNGQWAAEAKTYATQLKPKE